MPCRLYIDYFQSRQDLEFDSDERSLPLSLRRRPAPAKPVRAGRQFSAQDPDVRGNLPDENGNYDFQ